MSELLRGTGWCPDNEYVVADQLARYPLARLIGGTDPVIGAGYGLSYKHLLDGIPNQGPTSSCVGQAFSSSLLVTAHIAGLEIPRPSAKLIYDFARAEAAPYVPLNDVGSRPILALRCLLEKGMVAHTEWPLVIAPDNTSNVNDPPPHDIYQSALAARLESWYRIGAGMGASDLIRAALSRGYCPVFAMPVDSRYMWWQGGSVYEGRAGTILGWHMQAVCGFGDGFIEVVSSWGRGHGDVGIVKVANAYFDSGECLDIIVPKVVPPLTA